MEWLTDRRESPFSLWEKAVKQELLEN